MKFEINEVAKLGEESVTIKVAQKNFSTKKINYLLTNGEMVEESKLTKIKAVASNKGTKADTELPALRKQYEQLFGKAVPNVKKNNVKWIQGKIVEKGGKKVQEKSPYKVLAELNHNQLIDLILEKKLEIDTDDYSTTDELLQAVCDELDVTFPKNE